MRELQSSRVASSFCVTSVNRPQAPFPGRVPISLVELVRDGIVDKRAPAGRYWRSCPIAFMTSGPGMA
jgi:hypothetical protein